MGAVLNGLALRLAALMEIPVIYVFTHDSIGVGEDGPTHQPSEQLASLRAVSEQHSRDYRDRVIPPEVTARVSVEQTSGFGWDRSVGPEGVGSHAS